MSSTLQDFSDICYFCGSTSITEHSTYEMISTHGEDEFLRIFYPTQELARLIFYKQKRLFYENEINKIKNRLEKKESQFKELQDSFDDIREKYPEEFI